MLSRATTLSGRLNSDQLLIVQRGSILTAPTMEISAQAEALSIAQLETLEEALRIYGLRGR